MDRFEIDRFKANLSIVSVMRQHGVEFQEKRGYYMCRCPFHDDKTPSMAVYPEKNGACGHYHCYGCGESGDVIKFVIESDHLTFPQALEMLGARSYNYSLPPNTLVPRVAKQKLPDPAKPTSQERLRKNEEFLKRLTPVVGEDPYLTVANRVYEVSFFPIHGNEDISEEFRKFRGRIVFPFRNDEGELVGLLGRKTELNHPDASKYVNSSEKDEFHKGNNLYGLYQAKEAILETGSVFVTEGPKDCIAMATADIRNVVALCTSSLGYAQCELLKKYKAERVYLMLDGDGAGQSGMLKAQKEYGSRFEEMRGLVLPEGEDPDSLYRSLGGEGLARYADHLASAHHTEEWLFAAMLFHNDCNNGGFIGNQALYVAQTLDRYGYAFESKEHAAMLGILSHRGGEHDLSLLHALIAGELHRKYDPGMKSRIEKIRQKTAGSADCCVLDFEKLLYRYLEYRFKAEIRGLNARLRTYLNANRKDEAEILQEVVDDRVAKLKEVVRHLESLKTNPRHRV